MDPGSGRPASHGRHRAAPHNGYLTHPVDTDVLSKYGVVKAQDYSKTINKRIITIIICRIIGLIVDLLCR